jgi:preprotein translocase subunit SecF
MEFFRIKRDIPFMRYALVLNAISFITFALAVFFLVTRGLHLSIEFTGGTLMELRYQDVAPVDSIREDILKLGYSEAQVQNFGSSKNVIVRVPLQKNTQGLVLSSAEQSQLILAKLKTKQQQVELVSTSFVGPQVGKELTTDGVKALLFVVILIMGYLSLRFEWKYALSGIIANLHDIVIILGFFAFFQWEFSLTVLAAILAILGYSVNESVVIFDRIREIFRKHRKMGIQEAINHAITSTISRTIITHGCTQLMVLAMLLFGGASLHYFAVALTIGILFGIYSSVFVAAALAMWLGIKREDLIKIDKNGNDIVDFDKNDPNYGAKV